MASPANAATYSGATVISSSMFSAQGPLGVAAYGSDLYVTGPYFGAEPPQQYIDVLDAATGTVTASDPLPSMSASAFCSSNTCPASYTVEPYVAVSPGLGGFPAGEVYITQGPNIYEMAPGGGSLTLFTTVPGLFPNVPGPGGGVPEYSSGITFDNVGSFVHDMIVTSPNGTVWQINSSGVATEIGSDANAGTLSGVIEGPAVAPASFGPYAGALLVAAENVNEVMAVSPSGVFTDVASVPQAEGIQVVPSTVCGIAGPDATNYSWFSATFGTNSVSALPTSDFTGLSGDVLVQSEYSSLTTDTGDPSVTLLSPGSLSVSTSDFLSGLPQQEGAAMEQCATPPPPTGSAMTVGFWRNANGNHVLDPDGDNTLENPPSVTLGSTSFGTTVTTITESNLILSGGACTVPSFSCNPLSANLHTRTFTNLVAQTLALSYNIADTGFQGLAFSTDCASYLTTPLTDLGLSTSSTVQQVLTVANQLIAGSASAGSTTQAQAGAMDALLGECVNLER